MKIHFIVLLALLLFIVDVTGWAYAVRTAKLGPKIVDSNFNSISIVYDKTFDQVFAIKNIKNYSFKYHNMQ